MLETIRNFMRGSRQEQEKPKPPKGETFPVLNSSLDVRTFASSQDTESERERKLRRKALEAQQHLLKENPSSFTKAFQEIFKCSPQSYAKDIPRMLNEETSQKIEGDLATIYRLLAKASAETAYGSSTQRNLPPQESARASK